MKDTYAKVRLTIAEKELLVKKAEFYSMSISDYIKYCCLIDPPRPRGYGREVEYKARD